MHYYDVISKLNANNIKPIHGSEIYDYSGNLMEDEFDRFFEFGQTYLERKHQSFDVAPALMFFNTLTSVNAAARNVNNYRFIEINKGAIFWMNSFFTGFEEKFKTSELLHFIALSNKKGISPGYLMFQFCSLYFFYHEVGHLIQGKDGSLDGEYIEFVNGSLDAQQITVRHMREFDADWFASQELPMHIIEAGNGDLPFTKDEIVEVAALALSSIYIYYIKQSNSFSSLYLNAFSHPHPSVRLTSIVVYLLDGLSENLSSGVNKSLILKRTIELSSQLLPEAGIVEKHSLELNEQLNDIEEYVKQIISNTDKYPSLSVHKLL